MEYTFRTKYVEAEPPDGTGGTVVMMTAPRPLLGQPVEFSPLDNWAGLVLVDLTDDAKVEHNYRMDAAIVHYYTADVAADCAVFEIGREYDMTGQQVREAFGDRQALVSHWVQSCPQTCTVDTETGKVSSV